MLFLTALLAAAASAQEWVKVLPSATVQLRDAADLSVSAEGTLYIADTGHHRIIAVDSTGRLIAETGGFGTVHGQFQWPRAVISNRGNAVWVLDYGNRRIEKFTRSLEYQGTLLVNPEEGEDRSQPEAMALSPQGDLFVFDRDGGRLIRFDPLFTPQAELGSGGGAQFITNISAMAFVPARGLYWWSRGGETIEHADALLNPLAPLRLKGAVDDLRLAAADSCLLFGARQAVMIQCAPDMPPDTLIGAEAFAAVGMKRLAGIAVTADYYYVLDGGANAVYRIHRTRE
jgi:hypothetical protein